MGRTGSVRLMRVVIAGGHGKIALRLEKLLSARGDEVVGIMYRASHQAGLSLALWERSPTLNIAFGYARPMDTPILDGALLEEFAVRMRTVGIQVQTIAARDCSTCQDHAMA